MPPNAELLEQVLEKVRESRNFDFRNYKRPTLRRRVERRMVERKCRSMAEYLALLDRSPEECDALVSGMLIKVTSFYRDPDTWEQLRKKILPDVIAKKPPGEELRVWSVGCATGEETYSIAMLIAELLGGTAHANQVKVFGTDVDEAAIAVARRGIYTKEQAQGVGRDRLHRWFVPCPEGYAVRKEIRRMVVFGVNNLVSDAPISRLDLLLCRNVFIYLDAGLQKRILSRFHYALRPKGVLVLGKSELIPFAARVFTPADLSRRIYVRGRERREVLDEERLTAMVEQDTVSRAVQESREHDPAIQLHGIIVHSLPLPVIATSLDGVVTAWNAAAARLWHRSEADVLGKRLASLGLAGLPGDLLVEKTAAVREGKAELSTTEATMPQPGGETATLATEVSAVFAPGGEIEGLLYVVQDVTAFRRLEKDLRTAKEDREKAVEDLQTANEELQSSNEELETTNEELQSANEELQTTNEELQSTNEELETTNEELQSTNAELDATNRELAHRTEELDVLSFHQKTIIRSLSAAVLVLDAQGRITLWNLAAERLLALTESEAVGQLLWSLRIPILSRALIQQIRRNLAKRLALRVEDVAYERSGGAVGHAALSAVPLVNEDRTLGAVVILEDTTRAVLLAEERMRERLTRRTGPGKKAAAAAPRPNGRKSRRQAI